MALEYALFALFQVCFLWLLYKFHIISKSTLQVFTHFWWVRIAFSPTSMGENAIFTHFLKKWLKF